MMCKDVMGPFEARGLPPAVSLPEGHEDARHVAHNYPRGPQQLGRLDVCALPAQIHDCDRSVVVRVDADQP